jgi:hypothetical protein
LSKRLSSFKRYYYISSAKISMFDQQQKTDSIWQKFQSGLASITKVQIGQFSLERSLGVSLLVTEIPRMKRVLAQIKKEHAIGTIDTPSEYIQGRLPLFSRLLPSRPGTYFKEKDDPGLIYFGGGTPKTSLALIGSPFHLIGQVGDPPQERASDLPSLVTYLNERFGEIVPGTPRRRNSGISVILSADNKSEEPRIPMEFFAWRILDSADMDIEDLGMSSRPSKRLLLYSPIYVAYASD